MKLRNLVLCLVLLLVPLMGSPIETASAGQCVNLGSVYRQVSLDFAESVLITFPTGHVGGEGTSFDAYCCFIYDGINTCGNWIAYCRLSSDLDEGGWQHVQANVYKGCPPDNRVHSAAWCEGLGDTKITVYVTNSDPGTTLKGEVWGITTFCYAD